jgi:hypothetical protein
MRRLLKALAHRLAYALTIASGMVGRQHVGSTSDSVVESYSAVDIAVDTGTVKGRSIATLQDVEVELRGLVKSASGGSTIMYLSHDRNAVENDSYRNCINLIIDRKLKFKSPTGTDYIFTGMFLLVDRPDESTVYLTYKGTRFDADCQAFKKPDRYPYFVVKSFRNVKQRWDRPQPRTCHSRASGIAGREPEFYSEFYRGNFFVVTVQPQVAEFKAGKW